GVWMCGTGCVAAHSGLSARPLGEGALEVGLHGGATGSPDRVVPSGNVTVRAGVSDSTDLVLELGTEGLGVGVKAFGGALVAANLTTAGATVDLSLRAGPVRFVPELSVAHQLAASGELLGREETPGGRGATLVQGNVFLLFERRGRASKP
ncbi:MAG: hypothetical protein ABMA64_31515, partial [Myxococcota bacterium]